MIKLSCSGQPAGSTCSVSPSSVTPGTKAVDVTLKLAASKSSAKLRSHGAWTLAMCMPLFGLTLLGSSQRKLRIATGLLVIGFVMVLAGCGAASHTSTANPSETVNAAYNVTVTATSGSIHHSVIVPVAVSK